MNKKVSKLKRIKIIINILSLIIFVFSYFFICHHFENKREAAEKKVANLERKMKNREEDLVKESMLKKSLKEVNEKKQVIIDSFPVQIGKEDNFMFVKQIEDALHINFSTIDMTDSTKMYETILPVRTEAKNATDAGKVMETGKVTETGNVTDATSNSESKTETASKTKNKQTMIGMQTTINLTFLTTYNKFKKLVEYLKEYPDRSMIESASVSYDNATGELTGSLVIKRFALTGTGKVYEPPYIKDINIGTNNMFGTDK